MSVVISASRGAALAALGVALTGCPTPAQVPHEQFERQLHEFHSDMRWGRYEDAAAFVEVADRSEFEGMCEEYDDDFQITEYEFEDVDYDGTTNEAVVEVWVQWMRLPSTSMRETTYREQWAWVEEIEAWQLMEREVIDEE